MPKKGAKLSSAQRKSRARKAAITRCQNKCTTNIKRKMSSSKKRAAKARAAANPWLRHVSKVRKANPGLMYKDVLKVASGTYDKKA